MTHDFTPPGGFPPSNTPDARASSPSASTGSGAGLGTGSSEGPTNMLRSGRRVAFAAWLAIVAGILLLVGLGWSAALALADETLNHAQLGETGPMHAANVVLGMCLTDVGDDGNVDEVEVVACDEPHRAEVFTQKTFDLAKHPGVDEVQEQALAHCGERLEGQLPDKASWVTWTPSPESWQRGDRIALCIAVYDEPRSEPLSPHGIRGLGKDHGGTGA